MARDSDDFHDLLADDAADDFDALDEVASDELLEDILDAADGGVDGAPALPRAGYLEPLMDMPPNQATMECLRGPCCYHWHLTWRMQAPGRDPLDIRVGNNRHCTYGEGVALNGRNVFRCTRWWPKQLGFVPEVARALLRDGLRTRWERQLERDGYDLSWRVWPDDIFEMADRPEFRDAAGLEGNKRPPQVSDFQKAARKARESREKGNGTK